MKQLSFRSKQVMLLSMLFCLFTITAFSQSRTINGTVRDQEANSPLPAVSVSVKGTTTGAQTDAQGRYSVEAPVGNATLVFTYAGFVTQEVNVGNDSVV